MFGGGGLRSARGGADARYRGARGRRRAGASSQVKQRVVSSASAMVASSLVLPSVPALDESDESGSR